MFVRLPTATESAIESVLPNFRDEKSFVAVLYVKYVVTGISKRGKIEINGFTKNGLRTAVGVVSAKIRLIIPKERATKKPEEKPSRIVEIKIGICAVVTLTIGSLIVPIGVSAMMTVRVIIIAVATLIFSEFRF